MSPRIHPLIIRGTFPSCHVAVYTPSYYTRHFSILSCRRVYTLLLYAAHFHLVMSPRIHPLIIRGTFPSCHVSAYTPSYYTRHISILSCLRVCTLLLYAVDLHPVMSPRIHPLIIRGTFPSRHVAVYTPSYYTRHLAILACRRVYSLLLYAVDLHPVMSPRIHPLIIRGTFPSRHVAAYTPSYYTRNLAILACRRVYSLILYAAPCHPGMSPRILSLIIRGRFTSCHVSAYTPSYYTRHISIPPCRRVYTLLFYAVDLHLDMSPRIHPHIIRGTLPPWHVAAYTPSYYTRHLAILACRRVYSLLLYAPYFHPVMSPRIHPLIIRGTFPSCHVAAYTPSYYTRNISILSCRRIYTLLLYAAHLLSGISPHIRGGCIRGTFA